MIPLAIAAPAPAYTARGSDELAIERYYSSYPQPPLPAEVYYSSYGKPETLSPKSDDSEPGWPLIVLAGTSAFAVAAVGRRHVVVRRRHRTIPT